jgi:hypothetical protein
VCGVTALATLHFGDFNGGERKRLSLKTLKRKKAVFILWKKKAITVKIRNSIDLRKVKKNGRDFYCLRQIRKCDEDPDLKEKSMEI